MIGTAGSLVAMYMPTNNNQLGCGFTACSMGAARKPQQYNYNSFVAVVRVPIMAVIGTLVYGTNTLCVCNNRTIILISVQYKQVCGSTYTLYKCSLQRWRVISLLCSGAW